MIIDGATVPSIVPQVHSPITYHKERSGTRWERTPGKKTRYSEIWDVGVVSQHAEELVAHNSVVTSVTDQEDGYAHGVIYRTTSPAIKQTEPGLPDHLTEKLVLSYRI